MNARVQERRKKNSHENRLFKNWAKINWQDRLNIKLYFSHGLSTGRKNFSRKNNRATHPTSENLSPQISYGCRDQRLIFILDLLASLPVTKVHVLSSLSLKQVIFKALKYPDEKKTSPSLLIHDLPTIPNISWEQRHFYDLDHFNVWRSVSLKMSIYGQKDPIWISTCWEGFIFLLLNGVKMGHRSTLEELESSFPHFPRKTKARNINAQFFFLSYPYKNNIAYLNFFWTIV